MEKTEKEALLKWGKNLQDQIDELKEKDKKAFGITKTLGKSIEFLGGRVKKLEEKGVR